LPRTLKDKIVEMETLIRPLVNGKKKMLEISKENITQDLRTLLRSYHVDDLEALMILADEFEELQKDRQAFAVEPKLAESAAAPVREKM